MKQFGGRMINELGEGGCSRLTSWHQTGYLYGKSFLHFPFQFGYKVTLFFSFVVETTHAVIFSLFHLPSTNWLGRQSSHWEYHLSLLVDRLHVLRFINRSVACLTAYHIPVSLSTFSGAWGEQYCEESSGSHVRHQSSTGLK